MLLGVLEDIIILNIVSNYRKQVNSMATSSFERPLVIKDRRALAIMAKGFARTKFRQMETSHTIDAELQRGRALLEKASSRLKASLTK
ncbi:hypothetical protein TcarDRAFT_0793 [Thermosinus carboxydivorans Nor1]|uniref:Uncharacterized protein n=1 Tax=Thermosinus carboxydivorans Nor1 TaxID=401526 RepID=A1HT48_9FIRM|nr:hypothetical protein TcarDRAFT_0793 [Thermosinus carboxydivorans Nor1]